MLTPKKLHEFKQRLSVIEHFSHLPESRQDAILNGIFSHQYMDLRCDWAFKYVLDDDEILKMLLEDMLPNQQIQSVKRLPNQVVHRFPDDKSIVFDVVCETPSGKMIVEMQRAKKPGFKNRMVYYGASMIQNQLKRKAKYTSLMPVYVICFMDYGYDDQTISRYALTEQDTHALYGDQLWIYLCNLQAFNKTSLDGLSPQEVWLYILKNMINFAGNPEQLGERYAKVAYAARVYPLTEDEQFNYIFNMLSEQEKLEIREAYYKDGFEDGMEKGMEMVARNLLKMGMPPEDVTKATGLSLEVLTNL